MAGFREAVDLCGLADLGYIGLDWTFEMKVREGHYCRVRLDRALATASWSAMFPFATVRHLVGAKSDHSPIVLFNTMDATNRRIGLDRPFRYEMMWETHQEFFPMLEKVWKEERSASSVEDIKLKLGRLASALAGWGTSTFGAVRKKLRELKK